MNDIHTDAGTGARRAELPLSPLPQIPHWLENYAWDAYDPDARIGIYLHVGRWYRDPALWHELVLVCLDGKTVYSRRNIGRLEDPSLVGASCLRLSCEEPMRRWRWQYRGPVLKGEAAAMMHQPPADGVAYLLDFDLDWQATSPVVDFGHGTEPGGEASHYEQAGRISGKLRADGQTYAIRGHSFRDHSRGPRVLNEHFNRHTWIHGGFPSGRTLSSLIVETPDGKLGLDAVFAVDGSGHIERYRFKTPLLWDSWEDMTRPYVLEGINDAGRTLKIDAEPHFFYPATLAPPMDLFVGQSNDFSGWRVFQMPTRLRWDGEVSWGHTEFTLTGAKSRSYPELC
jgi:hypothetical protein